MTCPYAFTADDVEHSKWLKFQGIKNLNFIVHINHEKNKKYKLDIAETSRLDFTQYSIAE